MVETVAQRLNPVDKPMEMIAQKIPPLSKRVETAIQ